MNFILIRNNVPSISMRYNAAYDPVLREQISLVWSFGPLLFFFAPVAAPPTSVPMEMSLDTTNETCFVPSPLPFSLSRGRERWWMLVAPCEVDDMSIHPNHSSSRQHRFDVWSQWPVLGLIRQPIVHHGTVLYSIQCGVFFTLVSESSNACFLHLNLYYRLAARIKQRNIGQCFHYREHIGWLRWSCSKFFTDVKQVSLLTDNKDEWLHS